MGSILPFIARSGAVFNDVATQVMGEAFDAACNELHDKGQPTVVYDVIAKRIIDAARNGERDPVRLRNVGLAALGIDRGCVETGDRDTLDQPVSPKTIPPGNPEGP